METCKADTYRRFWLTVIYRTVLEADGKHLGYAGDTHDVPEDLKQAARRWLSTDSLDLRGVCYLAGMSKDDRIKLVALCKEKYARSTN